MKKQTDFRASVRVRVWAEVTLRAKTFEDALVEAKALQAADVVEVDGDVNDWEIAVFSVCDNELGLP